MIEIKALCAICGPDLFHDWENLCYRTDGQWIQVLSPTEAVDLAMEGVGMKRADEYAPVQHFRAVILISGTGLCGSCARSVGVDRIRRQVMGLSQATRPVTW